MWVEEEGGGRDSGIPHFFQEEKKKRKVGIDKERGGASKSEKKTGPFPGKKE